MCGAECFMILLTRLNSIFMVFMWMRQQFHFSFLPFYIRSVEIDQEEHFLCNEITRSFMAVYVVRIF